MKRLPCLLHITQRDGRPLSGVKFVVEEAESPVPEIGYVTGADGGARVGLPPGQVRLRFFLPDDTNRSISLAIADEPNKTYDVLLDTD